MLNNLAGQTGEALGLTDFAQDRFSAAEEYASTADQTAPVVRDLSQVRGMESLLEFVTGQAGSGLATSAPVLATAVGLRRPVAGVFGGSTALEAGEQVGTLRADQQVMATTTPQQRLENALGKGAVAGALETAGGATGIAARTLASGGKTTAKGLLRETAKGTLGEAITEGAQDVTGQVAHQQLNPNVELDLSQTLNAAAAGAAGGGVITGGAKALSTVPALVRGAAESVQDLRTRLNNRQPPPDPTSLSDADLPANSPVEAIMDKLSEKEAQFGEWWAKAKERPEFEKLRDLDITVPEELDKVVAATKQKYNESTVKPKIDKALEALRGYSAAIAKGAAQGLEQGKDSFAKGKAAGESFADGFMDKRSEFGGKETELGLRILSKENIQLPSRDPKAVDFLAKNGYKEVAPGMWGPVFKRSEVRTITDERIERELIATLPQEVKDTATPEQIRELSGYVKELALHPESAKESATASYLRDVMGPDFRILLDTTIDSVYSSEAEKSAAKSAFNAAFKSAGDLEGLRTDRAKDIIRTHLRPRYANDPQYQQAVEEELIPQMLRYIENGRSVNLRNVSGDKGAMAEGDVAMGNKYSHVAPEELQFREALDEAFTNPEAVLDMLDEVRDERPITSNAVFLNDTPDTTEPTASDEDVEGGTTAASAAAGGNTVPQADFRIGKPVVVNTPAEAQRLKDTADAIQEEYGGRKNVEVRVVETGNPNEFTIEVQPADQAGLSPAEWKRVLAPKEFDAVGLDKGSLVVRARVEKEDGGVASTDVKINLVALTREMMRREGQQTKETDAEYVADMFSRGIAALAASKIVNKKTGKPVDRVTDLRADFPDNTLVFVRKGGQRYTYADIKYARRVENVISRALRTRRDKAVEKGDEKTAAAMNTALSTYLGDVQASRDMAAAAEDRAMAYIADDNAEQGMALMERLLARAEAQHAEYAASSEVEEYVQRRVRNAPADEVKAEAEKTRSYLLRASRTGQALAALKSAFTRVEAAADRAKLPELTVDDGMDFILEETRRQPVRRFEEDTGRPLRPNQMDKTPEKSAGAPGIANRTAPEKDLPTPNATSKAEAARQRLVTGEAIPENEGALNRVAEELAASELKAEEAKKPTPMAKPVPAAQTVSQADRDAYNLTRAFDKALAEMSPNEFAEYLAKNGIKLSSQDVSRGKINPEIHKAVKAYVERVLGKDKTAVIFRKFESAGGFAKLDGVETLVISVDAIDPMSVAYHEALHALFSRIIEADPAAAKTLLRAAQSPVVQARLKQLLKGHPKALEQLKDPEESLAYMYQFWASGEKGLLSIGTQTKTWFDKVKSFFRVIAGLWADELQTAQDIERAGEILDAFHRGEMADRSVIPKVLGERVSPDFAANMSKNWPTLGRLANKFLWTASGAVRDMNLQPLSDVMDKFHTTTTTSGKGPGWLEAKHAEYHKRLNRVAEALRGKTKEQQKEILAELRSGQPRTSHAAREIESVLKEAIGYMQAAGVKALVGYTDPKLGPPKPIYRDIREIKDNYFPRLLDADRIRSGREDFLKLMKKHKIKDAELLWAKLADQTSNTPPSEDMALGLTLFMPNVNERSLANIPDAELAPFMNDDLFGTMSQYLGRAARRAEYTRRFGNSGEAIREAVEQARELGATEEQLATFDQSVKAMEGTIGANMSNNLRHVYGALTTYQNVRLLPLALFSSLVDPLGIAVRGGTMGEAFAAFKRGITDLVSTNKDDQYMLATTIGAISAAHDMDVVGDLYSSQFMPAYQRHINETFFRFNGMESWNRSMRVAASAAAEQFIIRHATKPNKHSERYLSELGLTAADVSIKDGKLDMTQKTVDAINMWVDQSIIRPNAANRPVYMSDPNWVLISHLKQYTYMFQKVILSRVYHELQHGNYSAAYAMAGYVPMIIASDMLRVALTPGDNDDNYRANWSLYDWLFSGIQRAGLFGPGQMILDSGGGTSPLAVAGPTVEQLADFVKASAPGGSLGNEFMRAVPGARFFQ
jgi:hypothetical protein